MQKTLRVFVVILTILFNLSLSQAKGGDEQDQVILLNDSAAALEDSDPALSKSLAQFADEKEKDWEASNANKAKLPTPVMDKDKAQDQIRILKAAAVAMQPVYPIMAKNLNKMADDINKTIE